MVLYTWENGIYNPTPFIINNSKNTYIHNGLNTNTNNYAYYIKSSTYCQNSPLFDTAKKHQTILLNAKGFQNLIVLKWNPYLGWDKVKNYSVFRKHSDSTNFNLIATINKITEYFDSAVNCNFTYQYYIIAEENAGNTQVSYSNIVSINSLNPTIPNNPSILRATVNAQNEIQIDWDGSKNNINAIKNYSLERSIDGLNYSAIKQTLDSICCIPFLDYNINTDITSYFYRLSAKDECEIKSNYSNIGKTILLNVIKKKRRYS